MFRFSASGSSLAVRLSLALALLVFSSLVSGLKGETAAAAASRADSNTAENLQPVIYRTDDLEERAFALINQTRATYGLAPLKPAYDLYDVARRHSLDMVERDYFAHSSPEGRDLRHRIASYGITSWRHIAENIAYNRGYDDPVQAAVEGWMNSPGHRRNILNKGLTESGIGVAIDRSGRVYFTQVFATR